MHVDLNGYLKTAYRALPMKGPMFRALKTMGFVPSTSMSQRLIFEGIVECSVDGREFRIHGGGSIEASIFWQGVGNGWEGYSLRAWAKLCKRHQVIFDIGANTGIYSIIAGAINPRANIFSFEPMPHIFENLRRNQALNGFEMELVPAAASNYDGSAQMWEPVGCEISYGGTVNSNIQPDVPSREITVECVKLSTFAGLRNLGPVDLVKIDVETHEPEVIEGMGPLLDHRPTILFEVWNTETSGKDVGARIEGLLGDRGYLYFATDEESPFRQVKTIESHDPVKRYTNFIACTPAIAGAIGLLTT